MKACWLTAAVCGLGILAGNGLAADARVPGWESDYAAARVKARKTGMPMLVVFRCVP